MFNHDSLDVKEGSVEDLIIDPDSGSGGCSRSVCLGVSLDGGEHVTGVKRITEKIHILDCSFRILRSISKLRLNFLQAKVSSWPLAPSYEAASTSGST